MSHDDDDEIFLQEAPAPAVVTWFKVYCGLLVLMYLAVAGFSLVFFLVPAAELEMEPLEAQITGVALLVVGAVLFLFCLIPLLVLPAPWVWIYDLLIICIGLTSACCWPVSIPLLIFWLKPETKRYFGRT